MIEVQHLSHQYRGSSLRAIDDISFNITRGEIFRFLGPSGAGKSTTQGIITGLPPI